MNLIILFIAILALLVFTFVAFGNDYLSPSILTLLGFAGSVFVAVLNLGPNRYGDIIPLAGIIYFLGLVGFIVGEFIVKTHFTANKSSERNNLHYIKVNKVAVLVLLLVTILIVLLSFREVIRIGSLRSSNKGNIIFDYKNNSLSDDLSGSGYNSLITQLEKINYSLGYIFLFIFINNLFCATTRYQKKENFLNLLFPVLLAVKNTLKGGRFNTIAIILTGIFIYLLYRRRYRIYPTRKRKTKRRKLAIVLVSIFVLFIAFWASSSLVGREGGREFFDYISEYIGAEPKMLSLFLEDGSSLNDDGYPEVFGEFIKSLNKYGLNIPIGQPVDAGGYRIYNGLYMGNCYSAFRSYYHDFGLLGVFVVSMLISLFFNSLYYKLISCNYLSNHRFLMIFYSSNVYKIIFQFFGSYFLFDFTIGFFTQTIVMYLLFLFVMNLSSFSNLIVKQHSFSRIDGRTNFRRTMCR